MLNIINELHNSITIYCILVLVFCVANMWMKFHHDDFFFFMNSRIAEEIWIMEGEVFFLSPQEPKIPNTSLTAQIRF